MSDAAAHGQAMLLQDDEQIGFERFIARRLLPRKLRAILADIPQPSSIFFRDNLVYQVAAAARRDRRRNSHNVLLSRLTRTEPRVLPEAIDLRMIDGIERGRAGAPFSTAAPVRGLDDLVADRSGRLTDGNFENDLSCLMAQRQPNGRFRVYFRSWENRYYLANAGCALEIAHAWQHAKQQGLRVTLDADITDEYLDGAAVEAFRAEYIGFLVNHSGMRGVNPLLHDAGLKVQPLPVCLAGQGLGLITVSCRDAERSGLQAVLARAVEISGSLCFNRHLGVLLAAQQGLQAAPRPTEIRNSA